MSFFQRFDPKTRRGKNSRVDREAVYHQKFSGAYLADVIFGANDGIITVFAVVAASWGAALAAKVIIILGAANLVGDGLSMGLGNYLGKKSELEHQRAQRQKEEWEVEHLPEKERKEIRDILQNKGFTGQDLERAVEIISSDKKVWVDFMMTEELGIFEERQASPLKHGLAIFLAFALAGLFPLLPFLISLSNYSPFVFSAVLTVIVLFVTGALRAKVYTVSWLKAGLEMLMVGFLASVSAYGIGFILEKLILK